MNPSRSQLHRYLLVAAILQIVWGLTPSASKLVIEEIPVELYITTRWTVSGLIFATYLLLTRTWKRINATDIGAISLLGLLGYGLASFGTLYGLEIGGVTNFALMAALSPIISSTASIFILKESPQRTFYIALPLGVVGLLLLVIGKYQVSSFSVAGASVLLILGAYICEALVFVYSKRFKRKVDAPQYLAIAQISTALFMWLAQFSEFNQMDQITQLSLKGVLALIFVSVVSCVLCFAILYWLLHHFDGHRLALFDGLHTLSAVLFGYLFFQEEIRLLMLIGGSLILLSLIIGSLPQQRAAQEVPE